jgi:hypothetical protein
MHKVALGFNLSTRNEEPTSMSGASQDSRGLVTPPNSQIMDISFDAARSLISPPPEETLRRHPVCIFIFLHENELSVYGLWQKNNSQANYSPDMPSRETSAKRKRRVTTILSSNDAALALSDALNRAANSSTLETTASTPNPKPRKLVRHHSKTTSTMSMESPTETYFHQIENLAIVTKSPKPSTKKLEINKSPRKQALMQSPHANNPDANYIPPVPIPSSVLSFSRRRRSTTPMPIPPYEPPTEQFTPPKEVLVTPIANVSSRSKKSTIRMKVTRPKLKVKTALPAIDLSKPVEPPSPSDDPLLLTGSDIIKKMREKKRKAKEIKEVTPKAKTPSSPPLSKDKAELARNDFFHNSNFVDSSEFIIGDDLTDKPIFDLSNESTDAGPGFNSDSDSDCEAAVGEFSGTGEYTGRFSVITVPTKADSSIDETEDRSGRWGTPRSPYPFRADKDGRNDRKDVEEEQTDEEEQLSEEGDGKDMEQPVISGGQLDVPDSETSFELQNSLQDSSVERHAEMGDSSTQQTSIDSVEESGPYSNGSEIAEDHFERLQDAGPGHMSDGEYLFSSEQVDVGFGGVHFNDDDSLLEPLDSSLNLPTVSDEQDLIMGTEESSFESELGVHSYGSDSSEVNADDDVTKDRDENDEEHSGDGNAGSMEQVDQEDVDVVPEADSLQMGEITGSPQEVSSRILSFYTTCQYSGNRTLNMTSHTFPHL